MPQLSRRAHVRPRTASDATIYSEVTRSPASTETPRSPHAPAQEFALFSMMPFGRTPAADQRAQREAKEKLVYPNDVFIPHFGRRQSKPKLIFMSASAPNSIVSLFSLYDCFKLVLHSDPNITLTDLLSLFTLQVVLLGERFCYNLRTTGPVLTSVEIRTGLFLGSGKLSACCSHDHLHPMYGLIGTALYDAGPLGILLVSPKGSRPLSKPVHISS